MEEKNPFGDLFLQFWCGILWISKPDCISYVFHHLNVVDFSNTYRSIWDVLVLPKFLCFFRFTWTRFIVKLWEFVQVKWNVDPLDIKLSVYKCKKILLDFIASIPPFSCKFDKEWLVNIQMGRTTHLSCSTFVEWRRRCTYSSFVKYFKFPRYFLLLRMFAMLIWTYLIFRTVNGNVTYGILRRDVVLRDAGFVSSLRQIIHMSAQAQYRIFLQIQWFSFYGKTPVNPRLIWL